MSCTSAASQLVDDDLARSLRSALVDELIGSGHLANPAWQRAFREVPRHQFVPAYFVPDTTVDRSYRVLTAAADREAWLRGVYADEPLVTQLDGRQIPERTAGDMAAGEATCSSSQPSLMALMLERLEVDDGMRILEVGTGVGYNAALLCERLGSANVTSVEIDPGLAEGARRHLAATGYSPTLSVGDGANGYEIGRPYDRLIATCGFPAVSGQWISQVRPGGIILVNLYRPLAAGALAVLTVCGSGRATGHFAADWAGFMPTRALSDPAAVPLFEAIDHDHIPEPRATVVRGEYLEEDGFRFLVSMAVPALLLQAQPCQGPAQTWLLAADGSYACQYMISEGDSVVAERSPQPLWSRLEDLWETWVDLGRPGRGDFGLTVTPWVHTLWHRDQTSWSMSLPAQ